MKLKRTHLRALLLSFLAFSLFSTNAFAQKKDRGGDDEDEVKYSIPNDTIRVSARNTALLKFMGEVQDAIILTSDYTTSISGQRVQVKPTVSSPSRYAPMHIEEGLRASPRQHTFIIEFVKDLAPEDQIRDYSSAEKMKERITYLEDARKRAKEAPPVAVTEPTAAEPEPKAVRAQTKTASSTTTKKTETSQAASTSVVTDGSRIKDIPQEKLKARVEQKVNAFYSTCAALIARRQIGYTTKYGMALFNNDEGVLVERYSSKTNKKSRTKIRSYFNSLSQLNYSKVEMTAKEINFVSKFIMGADGKWHGTAVVLQDFKGFNDDILAYADQTEKKIDIILEVTEVIKDGKVVEAFDIFLGNISVSLTES